MIGAYQDPSSIYFLIEIQWCGRNSKGLRFGTDPQTGIGKTKLFELIANGALETTSIGRRRLILYRSLQRLIEGPVDV